MAYRIGVVLVLAFVIPTGLSASPVAPPTTRSDEPEATSKPAVDDERNAARPADTATPSRRTEERCAVLERRLAVASKPLDECILSLLLARCILVEECAPRLAARCYPPVKSDEALTALANKGLSMLDRSAAALHRLTAESSSDVDSDTVSDIEDRIEMLRGFGGLFAVMGGESASEATRAELLSACNRLAVQLDNENPKVAASAKLWMAVAYRLAGRPDRALQLLRPVLSPPEEPMIDLTSRLQHCLALGDRGDYPAGLAVCIRIGSRVDTWFADEERVTRRRAAASVRYARIELLRGWAEKLRATDQADRAAEVEAEAKELLKSESWPPPIERRLTPSESIAGLPNWEAEVHPPPTGTAPDSAGEPAGREVGD